MAVDQAAFLSGDQRLNGPLIEDARIGFGQHSRMTWICPGDVCVRSKTPGVVVWNVSHMSRAGWCGGMFKSSKLYSSLSTSRVR